MTFTVFDPDTYGRMQGLVVLHLVICQYMEEGTKEEKLVVERFTNIDRLLLETKKALEHLGEGRAASDLVIEDELNYFSLTMISMQLEYGKEGNPVLPDLKGNAYSQWPSIYRDMKITRGRQPNESGYFKDHIINPDFLQVVAQILNPCPDSSSLGPYLQNFLAKETKLLVRVRFCKIILESMLLYPEHDGKGGDILLHMYMEERLRGMPRYVSQSVGNCAD
ncbi:hypothetical protein F5051DRAFT_429849 [Lentinula edodes]|nr:hypothetical protein F5051DRAFT_429849 [Lentinula edodes]